MAVTHSRESVGTTAVKLADKDYYGHVLSVSVQNKSGGTIYLGGEGVTTSDYGYELGDGEVLYMELKGGDTELWAVAGSTLTINVLVIEGGSQ